MNCASFYEALESAVEEGRNEELRATLRAHRESFRDCDARVNALHLAVRRSVWWESEGCDGTFSRRQSAAARESVFVLLHDGTSLASRAPLGDAAMRHVAGHWRAEDRLLAMARASDDDDLGYYLGGLEAALVEYAPICEIAEIMQIMRRRGCDENDIVRTALQRDDGVLALAELGYDFDTVDRSGYIALHHLLKRRCYDSYILRFVATRTRNKRPTDAMGRCLAHYIFVDTSKWGAFDALLQYILLGDMGFIDDYCRTTLRNRSATPHRFWPLTLTLRFD